MELRFEKLHGLGNDFLVVETEGPESISPAQAVSLCDRHFGVGGDGVLLVSPGSDGARARMTVLNADGSRPEMCGNGLRCVALYLARKAGEAESRFSVQTDAGPRECEVTVNGREGIVRTSMGRAVVETETSEPFLGEERPFSRISMGNPHAICFHPKIESSVLDELGARLSGRIAGGSNVEIATVRSPVNIDVDVWERGVGRTLACGTGAAATAVASVLAGQSPYETEVTVNLPGGPLSITVEKSLDVSLRGPAAWVYAGTTQLR